MKAMGQFLGGQWREGGGASFASINPATGEAVWQGPAADDDDVRRAIAAARQAFEKWSATPLLQRIAIVEAFGEMLKDRRKLLADTISRETGKPMWEALTEVDAMIGKAPISVEAYRERCAQRERDLSGAKGVTRFRAHGVMGVFGPFNLPGHVPNGHMVPAVLAGNSVVFKPSEQTPMVGQITVSLWQEAGVPDGVVNLVQGARDTGVALADTQQLDGLLFTGSFAVGRTLNRRFADYPGKIIALELGGNNPLIVHKVANLSAAAYVAVQSAFITSGQRCTCAARLVVPAGIEGDRFIERLAVMTQSVQVGPYTRMPEPFMGPVISRKAAERLLEAQDDLRRRGGVSIINMTQLDGAMLSPGLIDVTAVKDRADGELFGPLLQVIRTPDFEAAIREANNTQFGLAAGLLCDDRAMFDQFLARIGAGVVSWNRPTTGASSHAPFGGVGSSGNHRPTGYFAADYCSHPVASIEVDALGEPDKLLPGVSL